MACSPVIRRPRGRTSPAITTSTSSDGKEDPAENAQGFRTKPWTVRIDGLVEKPGTYALEDFLKPSVVEDRIYRMRCVEGWSMVIPWRGVMLADVIRRAKPTSKAAFVEFTTLMDPKQMPGSAIRSSSWPYMEGLRLDEAQHPLTLLATGVYGRELRRRMGRPCGSSSRGSTLQGDQEHRADPPRGADAPELVDAGDPVGVWLLRQRESRRRPSALESGDGASDRELPAHPYAPVQRLRRPGRLALRGMDLRKNY